MSSAPVCEIQPVISTEQPTAPALPAIPVATDLASALGALNAIGMWIRQATPILTQLARQGGISGFKTKSSGKKAGQQGRWTPVQQQYKTVRVTNPNDPSQYVDIQQIETLTMGDTITGEKWVWTR